MWPWPCIRTSATSSWTKFGTVPFLFRNDGGGRFTEVAAAAGLQVRSRGTGEPVAKSLGVAPVDLDLDGWLDLVVANDTVQNFVFRNQRDGTFKEVGATTGLAFDAFGGTRGAMGIDAAPMDEGDQWAIAIGNFANEMTALYIGHPSQLLFSDEALVRGIGDASRFALTFGVFFFDYDLDSWLDLLTVNGHIESDIDQLAGDQRYRQAAQLFWNAGGIRGRADFLPVPAEKTGGDLSQPIVGRGSAYADLDGDGDLDVVVTQAGGRPLLLRNELNPDRWVRFVLSPDRPAAAIGARLTLTRDGRTISRKVMPTRGYLSQSELPVNLPLSVVHGATIEVTWPDGSKQGVAAPSGFGSRVVNKE